MSPRPSSMFWAWKRKYKLVSKLKTQGAKDQSKVYIDQGSGSLTRRGYSLDWGLNLDNRLCNLLWWHCSHFPRLLCHFSFHWHHLCPLLFCLFFGSHYFFFLLLLLSFSFFLLFLFSSSCYFFGSASAFSFFFISNLFSISAILSSSAFLACLLFSTSASRRFLSASSALALALRATTSCLASLYSWAIHRSLASRAS